jgi:hypothetical protein
MTKPILTALYVATLLTASALLAQPASPLRAALPQFEVQNMSIPDAILKAGQQSRVPIGIDASDPHLWKKKVSAKRSNSTLDEVLAQILAEETGYTIAEDGRTVVIRPVSSPSDLLNTRIVKFESASRRGSAVNNSLKLWMALVSQLSPSREGFMGIGHSSCLDDKILPATDLSGKTVWKILDWIVGTHGAVAWVAVPFTGEVGKSSAQENFWRLVPYPSCVTAPPQ